MIAPSVGLAGLQCAELGLFLMIVFETDKSDGATRIALGNARERTTGSSPAATFWNDRVLNWLGRAPQTRSVGPAWYVLTVRAEVALWRVGMTLALIGGGLQIVAAA